MTLSVVVTVEPDGHASAVEMITEPSYGFAEAARACALRQRYEPPRDAAGRPTRGQTEPFPIRFVR